MTSREAFLERVRQAVSAGKRAGAALPLPERGSVGYQGAGADPVRRFCDELAAAGGQAHVALDRQQVVDQVLGLIGARNARKILVSRDAVLTELRLADVLRQRGLEVIAVDAVDSASWRQVYFQADVGVSGVAHLIAETGTVVMSTVSGQPRSVSLLPPVHIAVAQRNQILPDLFDLFDLFSPVAAGEPLAMPSCLTLITGPSKTGDIELRLVTGVHGPGELHVVVV